MRRLMPWLLLALLPITACNADQSTAPVAPQTPSASLAADPPLQVAANSPAPLAVASADSERYTVLPRPQPTQTPDKIEVVEIFMYTCPHCYAFEPAVNAWKKKLPADVAFLRVPASFGPTGPLLARSYYAAEALGVLDKMHPVIFDALHKQRRTLGTEEEMLKLFAENGIDPEAFRATLHSFAVDSKARRARQLEVGYGVTGVPAMAVNGKYGIGIARLGEQGMLKVADELIARERKAAQ
ncbi:MAG: thiol:disulfide interchange protein DsbA/DsbL [Nevskiales bacterium]